MSLLQLDAVRIAVADLDAAVAAYALLLGLEGIAGPTGGHRFQLGRGAVEVVRDAASRHAIRFVARGRDAPVLGPDACHGLAVEVAAEPAGSRPARVGAAVVGIDHVVVLTPDAARAIALWRDRCGLRLALDRVFPDRGIRLLFFRSGGITLEYASPHPAPDAPRDVDRFHGVSYRVADLSAHRERLVRAGVEVSPIRPGMRPGTSVATVRSGTHGVPTLLLELHAGAGGPGR